MGYSRAVLTPRDLTFVEKYVETMRPVDAARIAGFKQPEVAAYQVLRRPAIQAAIEVRRLQVSAELNVTPSEVIKRMMNIAYCDPKEFVDAAGNWLPVQSIPLESRLALSKIRVVKLKTETERTTTKEGKATVETVTTTHFRVLDYLMWDKPKMLNSLAEHLNLFGGGRPKSPLEDLSLEELERMTKANEAAVAALTGADAETRKVITKAMVKTTAAVMAEPAKETAGGNGAKKPNGKGNGHTH